MRLRSTPPKSSRDLRERTMNMQVLALAFLAATAIGGLAWVFLYPVLSGEKKAEKRRAAVAKSEPAARRVDNKTQRSRREQVEGSLKELEARRQKEKKLPLSSRLTQAGLDWTPQKFMIASGMLGAVCFAVAVLAGGGLLAASGWPSPAASACRAGSCVS